ncbi:MAG: thiamine biosynthesis lipoprotein [Candidatus Endobugula sp.]|jgi:thiamine biosynthesis lipoprotein
MDTKLQATGYRRQASKKTRRVLRASFLFVLLVFTLLNVSSCSDSGFLNKPSLNSIMLSGTTMGTTYHITIVQPKANALNAKESDALQELIDRQLVNINQLMSTYIVDSELSRFNQSPVGEWFPLSAETFAVIEYSLSLSAQSKGKFDVTVSPLIDLWGFGAEGLREFPSDEAISAAKAQVGWQSISLDKPQLQIKKTKALRTDLSAVAKGYGVDVIVQLLEQQKLQNYLVEIGGEIRVKGKNKDNVFWKVGIETPSLLQAGAQQIISLNNKAVATSGDYRNFFEHKGVRYSHTIDPDSGKPVIHNIASLTVISDTAMEADALATAFMAMGEAKALAMATVYNIPIYILLYENDQFTSSHSSSFEPYLH